MLDLKRFISFGKQAKEKKYDHQNVIIQRSLCILLLKITRAEVCKYISTMLDVEFKSKIS